MEVIGLKQADVNTRLGGDFKYFLCSTIPGEMIHFD